MKELKLSVGVDVERTPRVVQLLGLFDVQKSERSECSWTVQVPDLDGAWQLGLIVGPSGSGKSTLARAPFAGCEADEYDWNETQAVVDGFPESMGIKEVCSLLSSVGFSTPPNWLRPFHCLSNGEQFRTNLARALADPRPLVVVDEFTSVVDRTVAKIGSAAVAKAVRKQTGRKFVAVTCHHDVEEWLCPDWVIEMPSGKFARRSLRRPSIKLDVIRCSYEAWQLFREHHYLDTSLNKAAACFMALWNGRPVAFTAALHSPGRVSYYREHRTVCLPDFQGVGIGNALSEFVASVMKAKGKAYMSTTGNPAMIAHRCRSRLWNMKRAPSRNPNDVGRIASRPDAMNRTASLNRATDRFTAGFEFVGPANPEAARGFGLL